MFRVEPETVQKQDFVNPPPRMDMASVVAQAMKKVLNKGKTCFNCVDRLCREGSKI